MMARYAGRVVNSSGQAARLSILIAFIVFVAGAEPPKIETREYRIWVDSKPCGTLVLKIRMHADGSVQYTGDANVTVKLWFCDYIYSFHGAETWKDGRLLRLDSMTNDNGSRYQTLAIANGSELRITSNRKTSHAPANCWTASHWHLPSPIPQGNVTRIDPDTGKMLVGQLRLIGKEQARTATQPTTLSHYRIEGPVPVDLWYDSDHRLARQESTEDGYRTVLELIR